MNNLKSAAYMPIHQENNYHLPCDGDHRKDIVKRMFYFFFIRAPRTISEK